MCNYTLYVDVSKFVNLFVCPNVHRLQIISDLMYLTLTLIARDDYLPRDEYCSYKFTPQLKMFCRVYLPTHFVKELTYPR